MAKAKVNRDKGPAHYFLINDYNEIVAGIDTRDFVLAEAARLFDSGDQSEFLYLAKIEKKLVQNLGYVEEDYK